MIVFRADFGSFRRVTTGAGTARAAVCHAGDATKAEGAGVGPAQRCHRVGPEAIAARAAFGNDPRGLAPAGLAGAALPLGMTAAS
ncbi:MAG: hypothetical protein ACFBWO_13975 [Paracoccaceae bacterium]